MVLTTLTFEDRNGLAVPGVLVQVLHPADTTKIAEASTGFSNLAELNLPEGNYFVSAFTERTDDFYNPVFFIDILESAPSNDFVVRDDYVVEKFFSTVVQVRDMTGFLGNVISTVYGPLKPFIDPLLRGLEDFVTWASAPLLNILMGAVNPQIEREGGRLESFRIDVVSQTLTMNFRLRKASPILPLVAIIIIVALVVSGFLGFMITQTISTQSVAQVQRDVANANVRLAEETTKQLETNEKARLAKVGDVNADVAAGYITHAEGQRLKSEINKTAEQMNATIIEQFEAARANLKDSLADLGKGQEAGAQLVALLPLAIGGAVIISVLQLAKPSR